MQSVDGRSTRWDQHNRDRRRALVEDAVRAIRRHGPGVGMDEIAAQARTSKTVLYRHFGDKTGLYRAVVESVHDFILRKLPIHTGEAVEPSELVTNVASAYLTVVQRDPNLYQFVTARPAGEAETGDPVRGITPRIGDEVSAVLRRWLEREGLDPEPANIWGHGIVGFVWAVADRWIHTNFARPKDDVVAYINHLFTSAFALEPLPDLPPRSV